MDAVVDLADFARDHIGVALSHDDWENAFKSIMEARGIKMRLLAQAVRLGLTASTVSPPIFDILDLLGLEKVEARLRMAIAYAKTMS
jgi:glutamyl-tRNA synthetase